MLGFTKRFTEGAITLMVAGALLFSALLAMTGRRTGDLISSGDALSLVPGPFKSSVDRVRDAVVEGEIDAVTSCLSESTSGYWSAFYSEKNALGADDVVLMVPPTDDPPQTPGELQRALLSMHNQLSEWVDFIDIGAELGGPVQVRLDRSMLRHDVPVTDPNALLRAVAAGRELLGSPDESAADQSLRCSSRELL